MSGIKSTRYVRDGEVDPSIAANVAVLLGKRRRTPDGGSIYLTELEAWLLASKGLGALMPQQWDLAAKGKSDLGAAPSPVWSEEVYANALNAIQANWPLARKAWTTMGLPPEAVDALVFLDGENGEALPSQFINDKIPFEQALTFARVVGSSVPPIGRSWLASWLAGKGFSIDEARKIATDTYESGGDMITFQAGYERREAVAKIMRANDPGVSNEQIDRVVRSPMTLSDVRAIFGSTSSDSSGSTSSDSSGLLIGVGAAALALFLILKRR